MEDSVTSYGAVLAQSGQLVNVGDYVRLTPDGSEAQYGLLIACVAAHQEWFCVLRLFERVTADGDTLTNEFDCPLLELTKCFVNISPQLIFASVSIVHECGESCKFIEQQTTRTVERETIEENTQRLIYKHDFDNDFYVLNVFCMNQ